MTRFHQVGDVKLDSKDREILLELDMDARQNYSQIAKKVGLSKQGVEYKINKLISSRVITGFYPLIDMPRLGYIYCRTALTFENAPKKKQEEIIDYLIKDPRWFLVLTTHGAADLGAVMWTKKIRVFYDAVNDLLNKYGNHISEHNDNVVTNIVHLQRRFLVGKGKRKRVDIGETDERASIDEIDKRILKALNDDVRMPLVEMAKRVGESDRVVSYRIKKMEERRIIAGYRVRLDIKKLGFIGYKIWMHAKKRPPGMMEYLISNPNVTFIVDAVGLPEELDFEILVEKTKDLFDFIHELRNRFPTVLGSYRTLVYTDEKKIEYMPF